MNSFGAEKSLSTLLQFAIFHTNNKAEFYILNVEAKVRLRNSSLQKKEHKLLNSRLDIKYFFAVK